MMELFVLVGKVILAPFLSFVLIAGPWLCCCRLASGLTSLSGLCHSSPQIATCQPPQRHSCCEHKSTEGKATSSSDDNATRKPCDPSSPCPCKRDAQTKSSLVAETGKLKVEASCVEELVNFTGIVTLLPRCEVNRGPSVRPPGSLNFPFILSGREILRTLHILTC